MSLLQLNAVSLGYGGPLLLERVDLAVEPGERIALIGRNGTGKSSLLHIMSGELAPDDGEVVRADGLRVARLDQSVPEALAGSVFDVVAAGLGQAGALLADYHDTAARAAEGGDAAALARLDRIQRRLETEGGWTLTQRVDSVLSRIGLPADAAFDSLSGGLKRRAWLARALVAEPNLLLLDEPTNHLDLDGIRWLEEFLLDYGGALVFVTHDRAFLQRLARRIVELDRGRLTSWPGDYATYLARKQAALDAEARQQANFDKKLAQEEAWIRQGIKARRTRNEGRVRALERMRAERRERRERQGSAQLTLQGAERSGRIVIDARDVSFSRGQRAIVEDFSTLILRGDKVGIIGPNGSGKTTLLNLLLGRIEPDRGRIRHGTRLDIAYFDQHRGQLDNDATVIDNVGEGRDTVTVDGQERHVISYLQDFLFPPQRARSPVRALSGGERNRLLLAKLFCRPANLLVLDEPTNDLDIETLELLEARLVAYSGTLLLVSHDRTFLDNVVTSTLVFEGGGTIGEYAGGYSDWLRQRPRPETANAPPARARPKAGPARRSRPKLSYREQRELQALPGEIEALEAEQQAIAQRMADAQFYRGRGSDVEGTMARARELEQRLAQAYERWEALESRREP